MKLSTAENKDQIPADEPTISSIMAGSGEGRRSFLRLAWLLAGVAGLFVLGAFVKPILWPMPLSERARDILVLPSGAKVLKVDQARDRSFGDVWFTLAEPKGPASRLAEVWTTNGLPKPTVATSAGSKMKPVKGSRGTYPATSGVAKGPLPTYSYADGYARRTLTYDAKTRQYHFQSTLVPYE